MKNLTISKDFKECLFSIFIANSYQEVGNSLEVVFSWLAKKSISYYTNKKKHLFLIDKGFCISMDI